MVAFGVVPLTVNVPVSTHRSPRLTPSVAASFVDVGAAVLVKTLGVRKTKPVLGSRAEGMVTSTDRG
jgi:hypothetical protein